MNFITTDQVGGVVRTLLAVGGGLLINNGYLDSATATTISGAILTLVVTGWSFYTNRQASMIQSINNKDNGVKVVPEFTTSAAKVDGPLK